MLPAQVPGTCPESCWSASSRSRLSQALPGARSLAPASCRALASLFYGVSVADPILFGAVALFLAGVALLAIAGPAWRAARVSHSEAL